MTELLAGPRAPGRPSQAWFAALQDTGQSLEPRSQVYPRRGLGLPWKGPPSKADHQGRWAQMPLARLSSTEMGRPLLSIQAAGRSEPRNSAWVLGHPPHLTMQYEEGLGVKPVGVQSIQLFPHLLQLRLAALWRGEPGAHEQEVWVLQGKAREPFIPPSLKVISLKQENKTTTPSSSLGVAGYH